ncbi:chaplin [Streptomyces sp. NPDC002054]|uniref:chaplin n=1 Tax=Streptomyces sp. NPDC002054 TaxID=3154663 RepID=UPI003330AA64
MRQGRRNGLIAAVVVGGAVSVGAGGFAFADAEADGRAERSPGLLAGNLVQLPVHAPVNVCGNTVNVVGLLNPAAGNTCVNADGKGSGAGHRGPRSSAHPSKLGGGHAGNRGGAVAEGRGKDSPGVLSGNGIQLPVQLPVNVSGNSVNVVGVGNAAHGNESVNGTRPTPRPQPVSPPAVTRPATPPVTPPAPVPVQPDGPSLAQTGAGGMGYLLPGGGALVLGGVLLYRRFRLNQA